MAFSLKRFFNFFKQPPVPKPVPQPAPTPLRQSYQRSYDRYPIEFEVIVTPEEQSGLNAPERCALKDVSGGGAMFISRFPERYVPGQGLKLDIFLAGTIDVRACIKTEATVVRLHPQEKKKGAQEIFGTGVAVKFHQPFEFERMDPLPTGGF